MPPFGRRTPPNVEHLCEACNKKVSPNSKYVAREVTGWVAPRTAGGANHIRNAIPTGRYIHTGCLPGHEEPPEQGSLFA